MPTRKGFPFSSVVIGRQTNSRKVWILRIDFMVLEFAPNVRVTELSVGALFVRQIIPRVRPAALLVGFGVDW